MGKNNSDTPKKKSSKWVVIAIVSVVFLVSIGVAGWFLIPHKPKQTASSDAGSQNTLSDSVQKASKEAVAKVNSGDVNGGAQTLGEAAQKATNQSDKADLYSQQASFYGLAGNNDAAVAASKQAIEADPTNWKNYANLGFLYKGIGDKQNAIDYLNQAMTVMKQQGDTSGEAEVKGALTQLGAS